MLESFALQLAEGLQADSAPALVEGDLHEDGRPLTFCEFVAKVAPHYVWYSHNVILGEVAQKIVDGELKHVMIWVPPGTGKSETVSRLLTAYYIYRFPEREVGLVSYGADLAEDLSGDARDYFLEGAGQVDPSTNAKRSWYTKSGGGMWARGFGAGIRGRRFHLGVIDDPHKGPEDLESDALQKKVAKFYERTWTNRKNRFFAEGACEVIVMQRLHDADLCGYLLSRPDAGRWTIVALDAVRSAEPWQEVDEHGNDIGPVPSACTVWPDPREPGELLCPEILGEAALKENQADPDAYDAQFLQRPNVSGGAIFQREWFVHRVTPKMVPLLLKKVVAVDLAVSKKTAADFTVALPMGWGLNGKYYIFPPYMERVEAPDALDSIAAKAKTFGAQLVGVESVAYQLSFVQHMRRQPIMAGITIAPIPADVDKIARAKGWSPNARDGLIVLVDDGSGWIEAFLKLIVKFPKVAHDDMVDAIGLAFAAMIEAGLPVAPLVGGKKAGPLSVR